MCGDVFVVYCGWEDFGEIFDLDYVSKVIKCGELGWEFWFKFGEDVVFDDDYIMCCGCV